MLEKYFEQTGYGEQKNSKRKRVQNQTNLEDFTVELGNGETFQDVHISAFNSGISNLRLRRQLDGSDLRNLRPMLRRSKLEEIKRLIRRRYRVKAFLFQFIKKCSF